MIVSDFCTRAFMARRADKTATLTSVNCVPPAADVTRIGRCARPIGARIGPSALLSTGPPAVARTVIAIWLPPARVRVPPIKVTSGRVEISRNVRAVARVKSAACHSHHRVDLCRAVNVANSRECNETIVLRAKRNEGRERKREREREREREGEKWTE